MYTDIALLTPIPDLWTRYGVQTEPFPGPGPLAVPYTSLVWEAIHKHGGGCDYTSERVIAGSTVENGKLCYGPKQYGTLFLVGIEGIEPATLEKLYTFVQQGWPHLLHRTLPVQIARLRRLRTARQGGARLGRKAQRLPGAFHPAPNGPKATISTHGIRPCAKSTASRTTSASRRPTVT